MVAPVRRPNPRLSNLEAPDNPGELRKQKKTVQIYDTTLRDGSQGEGISLTVPDKLKLAQRLDEFGAHYIEGGWPGSNPKDESFFAQCKGLDNAKLVAFGSTRYKGTTCEHDKNVQALMKADTPVVTLVGKAWDHQVSVVLEATLDENLAMISDTVAFFKRKGREVMLDAEHFYDGYKASPAYALSCLHAAVKAGVDVLVLCDTNGGTLPWEIDEITRVVVAEFPTVRIGIHCHNDMELAVSNTIAAVHAGATLVQGTINGFGERTGNANLMSIVPTLQLKMGHDCVGDRLQQLTDLSRYTDEITNQPHVPNRPYVGASSFAHKGGLHVAAVLKDENTYQHIDPVLVGNERRILVSELSGRRNILTKAEELGLHPADESKDGVEWNVRVKAVLEQVKELENKGYSFEGAEASLELMLRRTVHGYRPPFELLDFSVSTDNKRVVYGNVLNATPNNESVTQASVKLALLGPEDGGDQCPTKICFEIAEGNGPVDAVNGALQKCLLPVYAPLRSVSLVDYKVRILDNASGTAAITRVMVEFEESSNGKRWTTVYAHPNIIVASVNALMDGFEVAMWDQLPQCIING
ncbi:(R)-citramalate synthase [Gracilariopsis chorda]|uniref:(R)-citramalate synthase n=1 Tax=Gracilariopsis chorda TaxID=448386 RepID=A0A2V3IHB1_9FLOR|nr:(R)-citramalate synthase [Gracilariopsis chorda]|eukprot:PXF41459.1 (R)-citramalate synthase [Gracilariopsis chorda]